MEISDLKTSDQNLIKRFGGGAAKGMNGMFQLVAGQMVTVAPTVLAVMPLKLIIWQANIRNL
jgi:hypothetical protein